QASNGEKPVSHAGYSVGGASTCMICCEAGSWLKILSQALASRASASAPDNTVMGGSYEQPTQVSWCFTKVVKRFPSLKGSGFNLATSFSCYVVIRVALWNMVIMKWLYRWRRFSRGTRCGA